MSCDNLSDRRAARSMMLVLVLLLLFLAACSNPLGEQFPNVEAIGMSETWQDWVIVGRFGPDGPCTLADVSRLLRAVVRWLASEVQ